MRKDRTKCGAQNDNATQYSATCQATLTNIGYQPMQGVNPGHVTDWKSAGADKKLVADICGILLGGFGVHKFILGYTTEGIIQIVITFVTCGIGSLVGLVEGIIYLTKTDEEFVRTYIQNKKGWF